MSKLFLTDNGRILENHNEDLTRWRWAKKLLALPSAAAGAGADLWFLACPYDGSRLPLRVRLNGRLLATVEPGAPMMRWHRLPIRPGRLRVGRNEVVLDCDAPAMAAWKLAIAGPGARPGSCISFDRGRRWHHDCMGPYGALSGEYVVRLRNASPALRSPAPPGVVYGDPKHPKLSDLRAMVPGSVTRVRDRHRQALALRTWVATRWSHDPFGRCYCPWDAPTILDWARHDRGHGGRGKVAMCVHFAVTFASLATALGHRARCVAITRDIDGLDGHFLCEVFDEQRGKWVLHDANYDVHYEDGQPLSGVEISQRVNEGATSLGHLVRAGDGMPSGPQRVVRAFDRLFRTGVSYRLVGVWSRMDFITDPSAAPGHHGSTVYAEPQWVWHDAGAAATAMFPWHADAKWFEAR